MQPDHHTAVQRLIQLRNQGKVAQMFTQEELMQYQQQVQQPQQPTQNHQYFQPRPQPRQKRGIVSMPRKRPAITVGRKHIQRRRR